MAKLHRPHIPLEVRCIVAWRQCANAGIDVTAAPNTPAKARLAYLLRLLFGDKPVDLHHRPALENRERRNSWVAIPGTPPDDPTIPWRREVTLYVPDANDPAHLVYLECHDHRIETHVRGVGALRSDTGTRNHQKAIDRNRGLIPKKKSSPIRSRGFQKLPEGYKHQWGKRR